MNRRMPCPNSFLVISTLKIKVCTISKVQGSPETISIEIERKRKIEQDLECSGVELSASTPSCSQHDVFTASPVTLVRQITDTRGILNNKLKDLECEFEHQRYRRCVLYDNWDHGRRVMNGWLCSKQVWSRVELEIPCLSIFTFRYSNTNGTSTANIADPFAPTTVSIIPRQTEHLDCPQWQHDWRSWIYYTEESSLVWLALVWVESHWVCKYTEIRCDRGGVRDTLLLLLPAESDALCRWLLLALGAQNSCITEVRRTSSTWWHFCSDTACYLQLVKEMDTQREIAQREGREVRTVWLLMACFIEVSVSVRIREGTRWSCTSNPESEIRKQSKQTGMITQILVMDNDSVDMLMPFKYPIEDRVHQCLGWKGVRNFR